MKAQYKEYSKENGLFCGSSYVKDIYTVWGPLPLREGPALQRNPFPPQNSHTRKEPSPRRLSRCSKPVECFYTNVQCRPFSENRATVTIKN